MNYNFKQSQASFNYLERGLNGVGGAGGMDVDAAAAEAAIAASSSSSASAPPPPAAPFHYLINEQAKSIAALQELQNEVSALLEFRDLVMETFPHLRGKDGAVAPGCGGTRWEPGVRVRRKLRVDGATDASLAAPRSRSNSHGHKLATTAKAGGAGDSGSSTASSAVQDSGFCADSSKEHCSTTSRGGATTESEDELWTLLELIEVRGTRLRREAEQLREKCEVPRRARSLQDLRPPSSVDSLDRGRSAAPSALNAPLGALDGVVSRPSVRMRGAAGIRPDPEKTAAILRETSVLELRRHLLTTVFDNQVVRHRLGELSRAHRQLTVLLDKANEDNEDLRFQLEEKSIELEGTNARVRLLERLQAAKLSAATAVLSPSPTHMLTHTCNTEQSSTESAHHDDKLVAADSPKRRPSRIPLKSYSAPKPPTQPQSTNRTTAGGKRGGGNRTVVPASSGASRRSRKSSQDSYTSTNSTPSVRRDPPSSPAPEKIPQRERIVSDSDSKAEFADSLEDPRRRQQQSFFDSIETEATADCDSLDDLV